LLLLLLLLLLCYASTYTSLYSITVPGIIKAGCIDISVELSKIAFYSIYDDKSHFLVDVSAGKNYSYLPLV